MLDTIYVGLTGLTSFSAGLRNISNNVANVNSPGYKGTELQFADLFYRFESAADSSGDRSPLALGAGLNVGGAFTVFRQGDLRDTGNGTDVAVDGNGFFILRRDGQTLYTRDGQFTFDADGFLVSRANNARVAGVTGGSQLTDISISEFRTTPARATTVVNFTGNLSANDSDNTHTVSDVPVFDPAGGRNALRVIFTNNGAVTPRSWLVQVQNAAGSTIVSGQEIRFRGDGSPETGFSSVTFSFTPPGGSAQTVRLDMGSPGGFGGVTNFSAGTDSTVAIGSQDGFAAGALTQTTFDADGTLVLKFSNGESQRHGQLALAWFDFLQGLTRQGDNAFANESGQAPRIGAPRTSLFGSIMGGKLEASNIDLAQEFSELIIIQRGYQASSQVISAANEMIQQLLEMGRRR